ncbi:unnamed protein product [Alopecurus aequalis]
MNSLLGKLTILMGEEFAKLKKLRKEVKFIRDELTGMKDALERLLDLDELDLQTRRWRDIVRDMSYDIEDIFDDFMQNIEENNKNAGFVSNTVRRLKTLRDRYRIACQIEDVKKRVLETSARRQRYKLDLPLSSHVSIDPRVMALYEKAANLVGMEGPKNELVNLLADEEKQLKCLKSRIPKLISSLLSEVGSEGSFHACDFHILLNKVREYLQHKRYLVILDDIWNVEAWGIIKCAFPENDLGSRVLVTTIIQDVAKACCSHGLGHILVMKPLSSGDSSRLFLDRIFGSEEACPLPLRDVSVEILKKCGGLPLAIVSISGMLASEDSNQKEMWEHVVNCLGSETNITLERMRQILNLSYKDLPPHLKTCLLYLGMYPEDYIITRINLEHQWIAEGFISKENGQVVEKVARNCFNELVNRSLIQPAEFDNQGSVTACRVHDMMLDLILLKSAEENFFTIVEDPQAITGLDYKIRRLSIRMESFCATMFPRNISMSQVRTIMLFGGCCNTSLPEFKFLRVFFSDANEAGGAVLTGLCKFYHLRYLHVGENIMFELPIQISVLQHLETLYLYHPRPSYRWEWQVLNSKILLSDGIGNLKFLRHLIGFDFAGNTIDNIKGLGELANLKYLVLVCRTSTPFDGERRMNALCSSLGRLRSLEYLLVSFYDCIDGLLPLSPPPTPYRLHTLLLSACSRFSRVPSWMVELRNLCELQCRVKELLNDGVCILAELPALTNLEIIVSAKKMVVISGGRGAFPALECFCLQLRNTSYLTFEAGAMPKLQKLNLKFNAIGSEQNGGGPAGFEHLLALEEFSAEINCANATQSEESSAVSALRSSIDNHPRHPRFGFKLVKRLFPD